MYGVRGGRSKKPAGPRR